jgi:predicted NBD/HSP70 family sugar kinase
LPGCWETEVGEEALLRGMGLPPTAGRGELLAELREAGPEAAARLAEFTGWLALGLVNVVNLFAPELVVLGDLFAALPSSVLAVVAERVQRSSMVGRAIGGTRVVGSALGADAQLVGAAELAFGPVLDSTWVRVTGSSG